ncbi:MAG: carboxypeptidase-like regulatory domain-containing protein, partial [Ignavibacteriaceae bacterium]
MKFFKAGGIILFLLVSFFATNQAQTNEVILAGFVRDSVSGETLIGTNILLYKDSITANKAPFRGVATNNYGFYAIPKLTKGRYYLIARNISYKISVQEINISISNGRVQNDINMIPENIKLKEVI